MAKEIKIKNVNGITLKTKNKYVDDNIAVIIDSENLIAENIKSGISILGVTGTYEGESGSGSGSGGAGIVPTGTIDITANGTYDVTNYANANVNVNVANENDLLQKRFNEHNGYGLFAYFQGTSVDDYITNLDLSNLTNCSYMFSNSKIKTTPQLDTSNVTNMSYMFHFSNVETIPQLDTSKVTNISSLFANCSKLKSVSQLNTSKATSITQLFAYCSKLEAIPQLDTINVSSINYTFRNCYILKKIDITSMDKITITNNSAAMCNSCYSLTKFIIRTMTVIPALNSDSFNNCYHFTGTVNTKYNPSGLKDGRIYVPDNMVDSLKTATNWSTYADIIVPLSTLQEE